MQRVTPLASRVRAHNLKSDEALYVSTSLKNARRSPGTKGTYTCPRVCRRNCVYIVPRTGKRCGRRACSDYNYCNIHLAVVEKLMVAPSRHLQKMGLAGLGLYAVADYTHALRLRKALVQTAGGGKKSEPVVFERGAKITEYGGEKMTKAEFDQRYTGGDDETAAYAWNDGAMIVDGLCASSGASYMNEAVNVGKLKAARPADFAVAFRAEADRLRKNGTINVLSSVSGKGKNRRIVFKAARPIRNGEELLITYDAEYWL